MKRLLCCFLVLFFTPVPLRAAGDPNLIRISMVSLKNFGKTKAKDPPRLAFIADRIAEQAVEGICAVDELQDSSGISLALLRDKVSESAGTSIEMALSKAVGSSKKEQFGFFWNPKLIQKVKNVEISEWKEFERDPAYATFKAKKGFDFTLCVFHTRPDSEKKALKLELKTLDDVFACLQDEDPGEKDIIFLGDFNAPPWSRPKQKIAIVDYIGDFAQFLDWAITDRPTNVLQDKVYDNIFFDKRHTTEFVPGQQHVVRIDQMWGRFADTDPKAKNKKKPVARAKYLQSRVMDHCPVFAEFRADGDDD